VLNATTIKHAPRGLGPGQGGVLDPRVRARRVRRPPHGYSHSHGDALDNLVSNPALRDSDLAAVMIDMYATAGLIHRGAARPSRRRLDWQHLVVATMFTLHDGDEVVARTLLDTRVQTRRRELPYRAGQMVSECPSMASGILVAIVRHEAAQRRGVYHASVRTTAALLNALLNELGADPGAWDTARSLLPTFDGDVEQRIRAVPLITRRAQHDQEGPDTLCVGSFFSLKHPSRGTSGSTAAAAAPGRAGARFAPVRPHSGDSGTRGVPARVSAVCDDGATHRDRSLGGAERRRPADERG
jgi:hypothetical protein